MDVGVTGMSCAGCVRRVERVAGAVPGVAEVAVNLATERAAVTTGQGFQATALADALKKAGFPVLEETLDVAITGMTCASCAGRVEAAIAAVPGVLSAAVNLASNEARVRVIAGTVDFSALAAAVRKAGYQAMPTGRGTPPPPATHDGLAACAALVLAAPLVVPMLLMPFGVDLMLPGQVQLVLAAIVQIAFGARFYRGAWNAARAGAGNMDTLVALGTSAAFGLSCWAIISGGPLYFEASATVIALVRLGKWLELSARRQAGAAIRALGALQPDHAIVRRDGRDEKIQVDALRPGDLLLARPGERIAADGIVREGVGDADESLLTGESLPVAKAPGSRVVGGAHNGDALLVIEVTATGAESRLARMVRMVEDAQSKKPPVQRLVDRISAVFVPVVIAIAVLTFLGWCLAGAGVAAALVDAVAVLVIACPCALGLATPAAIMVGTGAAARHGILIRDAAALEVSGTIRVVAFDKTGTLTLGRPKLVASIAAEGADEATLLRLAAGLQAGSTHPLARALLDQAPGVPAGRGVRVLPGRGVQGEVDGRRVMLGRASLMADAGVDISGMAARVEKLEQDGRTVSFLADGNRLLGLFAFGDELRPGAAAAIGQLRGRGMRVVLITGDNAGAAAAAARTAGIDEIHAGALPEDKGRLIADLRRKHGPVAMVGDGVNDAPALAAADLGIAMAAAEGTDVAASVAGITLMGGDPAMVAAALDISARTFSRIRQGLFWAFAYNVIGIPLAAAGLLSPVVAGAAMAFSSVSVVGSALLLRSWRPGRSEAGHNRIEPA